MFVLCTLYWYWVHYIGIVYSILINCALYWYCITLYWYFVHYIGTVYTIFVLFILYWYCIHNIGTVYTILATNLNGLHTHWTDGRMFTVHNCVTCPVLYNCAVGTLHTILVLSSLYRYCVQHIITMKLYWYSVHYIGNVNTILVACTLYRYWHFNKT